MRTLTARLVVTAVLLVAVVSLLLAASTALAMRSWLTDRLDDDVRASLERTVNAPGPRPQQPRDERRLDDIRGQGVGTLTAVLGANVAAGDVITSGRSLGQPEREALSRAALDRLREVPVDGQVHEVTLPGVGDYRVAARTRNAVVVVSGLPTEDVDAAVASLVRTEALVGLLAVLVAGGVGTVVVRRQLRPLREVAATAHEVSELPLASGDIDLSVRVPERLTDERTEVGRVGAALNSLLSHVETSLAARHRSEQQVRRFVADASHELRTPLATITGYAELARRRPDDVPALRTAMDKVDVESARMSALVEDLLLLARLDAGRPLAREPVDLTLLLLTAVEDARVLAPGHTWVLELPEESAVEVTGDDLRLHQVITNLLANARRHTPPGTTVTVRATLGDPVLMTVHDDGPGFPEAFVDDAFERFTRGDVARTRAESGAGLGLSLVKAIVDAHHGRVSLDTRPGSTTFTIALPR